MILEVSPPSLVIEPANTSMAPMFFFGKTLFHIDFIAI